MDGVQLRRLGFVAGQPQHGVAFISFCDRFLPRRRCQRDELGSNGDGVLVIFQVQVDEVDAVEAWNAAAAGDLVRLVEGIARVGWLVILPELPPLVESSGELRVGLVGGERVGFRSGIRTG
jgi:hypothetical protein